MSNGLEISEMSAFLGTTQKQECRHRPASGDWKVATERIRSPMGLERSGLNKTRLNEKKNEVASQKYG